MEENVKRREKEEAEHRLVRILSKDIRGNKDIYSALTLVKGISWAISNAICKKLKLDKKKQVGDFSEAEIGKIQDAVKVIDIPTFLMNRRMDIDSGEDKHLNGTDLELRKDFDIKRLKKIRCYKGIRHTAGLPVRGQRTKANFRRNRKKGGAVGVKTRAGAKR
mgnify:CR=1 FL=1|jgi:small subunit ribosomal protein S13